MKGRTHKEIIRSSILGDPTFSIFWPKKKQVGLIFPDNADPLQVLDEILEKKGIHDPDAAKVAYDLPSSILYCRSIKETESIDKTLFPDVRTVAADEILETALILCLCNKHFYDPGHSVIWTANRLQRKLILYKVGDFYAGD